MCPQQGDPVGTIEAASTRITTVSWVVNVQDKNRVVERPFALPLDRRTTVCTVGMPNPAQTQWDETIGDHLPCWFLLCVCLWFLCFFCLVFLSVFFVFGFLVFVVFVPWNVTRE